MGIFSIFFSLLTLARKETSMSMYAANSALLDKGPWPGITLVLSSIMARICLAALIMPSIDPWAEVSINGQMPAKQKQRIRFIFLKRLELVFPMVQNSKALDLFGSILHALVRVWNRPFRVWPVPYKMTPLKKKNETLCIVLSNHFCLLSRIGICGLKKIEVLIQNIFDILKLYTLKSRPPA